MKFIIKVSLLLFFLGLSLVILEVTEPYFKESKLKKNLLTEQTNVTSFYNKYPLKIIPYQVSNTEYILEAKIILMKIELHESAFEKSNDGYKIEGYQDGMKLTISYSIKNPYQYAMWISLPCLEVTSENFPKVGYDVFNSEDLYKHYLSCSPHFIENEPQSKSEPNRLYHIYASESLIVEMDFGMIPYSENVTISGFSIRREYASYEKALNIDLKANSIINMEIIQKSFSIYD
jgi:hypothetical protein